MQTDIAGRIEFKSPDFFRLPLKTITAETNINTGRTYFLHRDRIVAVVKPKEPSDG